MRQQVVEAQPLAGRVVVGVERRRDRPGSRAARAASAARRPGRAAGTARRRGRARSPEPRPSGDRARDIVRGQRRDGAGQGEDRAVVRVRQHDGQAGRHVGATQHGRRSTPAAASCVAELPRRRRRRRRPRTSATGRPSRASAWAVIAADPPITSCGLRRAAARPARIGARRRRAGSGRGWRRRRRARAVHPSGLRHGGIIAAEARSLSRNNQQSMTRSCSFRSHAVPCSAR